MNFDGFWFPYLPAHHPAETNKQKKLTCSLRYGFLTGKHPQSWQGLCLLFLQTPLWHLYRCHCERIFRLSYFLDAFSLFILLQPPRKNAAEARHPHPSEATTTLQQVVVSPPAKFPSPGACVLLCPGQTVNHAINQTANKVKVARSLGCLSAVSMRAAGIRLVEMIERFPHGCRCHHVHRKLFICQFRRQREKERRRVVAPQKACCAPSHSIPPHT